jgi:hypothetical protein
VSEAAPSVGGGATIDHPPAGGTTGSGIAAISTPFIGRIVQSSADLDPIGLQAQLDLATSVLGLTRCVDEIVTPAVQALRRLLDAGMRDAAQDRMATEAIRTWLNRRGSLAPPPLEIGPVLLACGPRDPHAVDLETLALLLRFRRRPCWVLGARVSTFTLTIAAQAAGATGVIVLSTETRGLTGAIDSLRAVDALGFPLFYTGSAFEPEPVRRRLPGLYLGNRWGSACDQVIETLDPRGAQAAGSPVPSTRGVVTKTLQIAPDGPSGCPTGQS